MKVNVIVTAALNKVLSYQCDQDVQIGQVVLVPLRGRNQIALVVEILPPDFHSPFQICEIKQIFPFIVSEAFLKFLQWVAEYTLISLGMLCKMGIPFSKNELDKCTEICGQETSFQTAAFPVLNTEQEIAAKKLSQSLSFQAFVLDGITGSGKTETYIAAILTVLQESTNQQVLILLPEIALTSTLKSRFERYFGFEPDFWHSRTTKTQKRKIWQKAVQGSPLVVIGTRSALFVPFSKLAMIVVDEEHDTSYKQNEKGFYHARDLAIVRSKMENCPVILASATPSIETMHNISLGKYQAVHLKQRFADAVLPQMHLIDMRQENGRPILSCALKDALRKTLQNHQQSLLFLNQRGYAPVAMCTHCGYKWRCPQCEVNLTFYKQKGILCCHHCGYHIAWTDKCPSCHESGSLLWGIGLEKMVEYVQKEFPSARLLCLSSETVLSKTIWDQSLIAIQQNQVDIIIGTQILAKGHHFPYLTTVGVVDADQGVNTYDLRAHEKTFQLLTQVAGRAGREHQNGQVFLQTYESESPLMQALVSYNRDLFYECEMQERQMYNMPPFCRLASVIVAGNHEDRVQKEAKRLAKTFPVSDQARLLGPAPAPFSKLRNRYRYRLLIKSDKRFHIQNWVKNWAVVQDSSVSVHVDIDPYDFS